MDSICISEIFLSIQGESSFAGLPCVFVRTAGCPLDCAWCDTEYAKSGGGEIALEQVLEQVAGYGVNLVEVTGGEPLAQEITYLLLERLCDAGHRVLLETGGAMDIAPVDRRVHVIMDLKTPSSAMHDRMRLENIGLLKASDEVKFVLADRADYEYARQAMAEHDLPGRCAVLLSPVMGRIEPREIVAWMLEDRLEARFQLQLHKQIWDPDQRGV